MAEKNGKKRPKMPSKEFERYIKESLKGMSAQDRSFIESALRIQPAAEDRLRAQAKAWENASKPATPRERAARDKAKKR